MKNMKHCYVWTEASNGPTVNPSTVKWYWQVKTEELEEIPVPVPLCPEKSHMDWSRWPRGLMRRSAAACLQGSRVRITLRAWMFVCCVSFLCLYVVLSCVGRGLCDGLITRPDESYRVSKYVWLRNLKGGGQGPIWAVEPLDGWIDWCGSP
jgi:hypothetical protein